MWLKCCKKVHKGASLLLVVTIKHNTAIRQLFPKWEQKSVIVQSHLARKPSTAASYSFPNVLGHTSCKQHSAKTGWAKLYAVNSWCNRKILTRIKNGIKCCHIARWEWGACCNFSFYNYGCIRQCWCTRGTIADFRDHLDGSVAVAFDS